MSKIQSIVVAGCCKKCTFVVFVEIGTGDEDTAILDFALSGAGGRRWDIKVTQLEISNLNK